MVANDYASNDNLGVAPVWRAAQRGEADILRALVDAGAPNILGLVQTAGNLGNPPAGLERNLFEQDKSVDNEGLPNRAVDRNFSAFELMVAEAARIYGPQSLEPAFAAAAYSGYNDAMESMIAAGLDLSNAKNPQRIWFGWASLGNPCKPSTGRILLREGLRADYPPSEETRWPPLHTVAVGCADARAVEVLVGEGRMDVNQIDPDGDTPLDAALRYRRAATVAVLQRLGGLTAQQAAPTRHAARLARMSTEEDLDLVQANDLGDTGTE
jgi:ankyrin repeat protein